MLRRLPFIVAILVICTTHVVAQREWATWHFGIRSGITFVKNGKDLAVPEPIRNTPVRQIEGTSVWSDPCTGDVLLSSDGMTVFDRMGRGLPNGTALNGGMSATQAALFVPHPGNADLVYLFTSPDLAGGTQPVNPGNAYNLIDMSANGGFGDVVAKNQAIGGTGSERLCATHDNTGLGYWVVMMEADTTTFFAYHVTQSGGLDRTPVISRFNVPSDRVGYMKISPDGRHLAIASPMHKIELFDFDAATGVLTNRRIPIGPENPDIYNSAENVWYGLAYSGDGKKLYCSARSIGTSKIIQFDLSLSLTSDIIRSGTIITTMSNDGVYYWAMPMQIGPTGKIYVGAKDRLHVIDEPTRRGTACNFHPNAVMFPDDIQCADGLPNIIESGYRGLRTYTCPGPVGFFRVRNVCLGEGVVVRDSSSRFPTSWLWMFPRGNPSFHDGPTPPPIMYDSPGTYQIILRTQNEHGEHIYVDSVVVFPKPVVFAGPDISACRGSIVQLQARGADRYAWIPRGAVSDPNSASPTIRVDRDSIVLIVTGLSVQGCATRDTIVVRSAITIAVVPGDTAICRGSSIRLIASGGETYEWRVDGRGTLSTDHDVIDSPDTTTTYRVIVARGDCIDTSEVTVTVSDILSARVTSDTAICRGTSIRLKAEGGAGYRWSPIDGLDDPSSATPLCTPQNTTTYTVTVMSAQKCERTLVMTVRVKEPPRVRCRPDTAICRGGAVMLYADGEGSATWSSDGGIVNAGADTFEVRPARTTTYRCRMTMDGCVGVDSCVVMVLPRPVLSIAGVATACANDKVDLHASGAVDITWYDGRWGKIGSGSSYTGRASDMAVVRAIGRSPDGCTDTAEWRLVITEPQTIVFVLPDVMVQPGKNIRLPLVRRTGLASQPVDIDIHVPNRAFHVTGWSPATLVRRTTIGAMDVLRLTVAPGSDTVAILEGVAMLSMQPEFTITGAGVDTVDCRSVTVLRGTVGLENCGLTRRMVRFIESLSVRIVGTGSLRQATSTTVLDVPVRMSAYSPSGGLLSEATWFGAGPHAIALPDGYGPMIFLECRTPWSSEMMPLLLR
ncbi:MAG: hypothetical protein J0I17_04150 ['Candidatus Kapabacteria' thiocyanatum]|uniref:PKD domain-containing protein n=1 Tax=Candidatus Kapaibacterium thiocyanatum TaxID=1895771 RepID=A0A1M3L5W7_9BACT|nr:hypothetical protein ['Candidatus Kapabacteria' thiocyanatum]OJX60947.1 MAG: hypothetical protein BGO89_05125 ['Candidatus Kapabacteria' thiocyanatum]